MNEANPHSNLTTSAAARHRENAYFVPEALWVPRKRGIATASRYTDDVIDLDIAIDQAAVTGYARYINFARYADDEVEIIKSFAWCGLNVRLPRQLLFAPIVRPSRLKPCVQNFVRYLHFAKVRRGTISGMTVDDNEEWLKRSSSHVLNFSVSQLKRLYYYRYYVELDIEHWREWIKSVPSRRGYISSDINKTARVPHSVLDPMLIWALFYISNAIVDLLAVLTRGNVRLSQQAFDTRSDQISVLPGTGSSWRMPTEQYTLHKEIRCAVTACYFVTAYLSGMRDGEAQEIREGGWGVKKDENGEIINAWVKSRSFKSDANGHTRDWIVISEVIDALDSLFKLKSILIKYHNDGPDTDNADLVFRKYGYIRAPAYPGARPNAAIMAEMASRLNEFQAHVNELAKRAADRAETADERDFILRTFKVGLDADGKPWRWMTKHLRRTVAWYIANEPFGIVAGMRQYGHVRDVTFQGYSGTEAGGFRNEIEQQRAIGQHLDIVDMYLQVKAGKTLGGAVGHRLEREFAAIAEKIGDLPGKIVDEKRLQDLLRNVAKIVYPLILNDCFFDADLALCLRRRPDAPKAAPIPASCDPIRCPNSCYHQKHAPALLASRDEAMRQRSVRGLSKNQRIAIDMMIERYNAALSEIGHGGQAEIR